MAIKDSGSFDGKMGDGIYYDVFFDKPEPFPHYVLELTDLHNEKFIYNDPPYNTDFAFGYDVKQKAIVLGKSSTGWSYIQIFGAVSYTTNPFQKIPPYSNFNDVYVQIVSYRSSVKDDGAVFYSKKLGPAELWVEDRRFLPVIPPRVTTFKRGVHRCDFEYTGRYPNTSLIRFEINPIYRETPIRFFDFKIVAIDVTSGYGDR